MTFYNHFYYSDRKTKVTAVSQILHSADNTKWYKDTGEIYKKSGNKLVKILQFSWSREDLDELFLSKNDDDTFGCSWMPEDDSAYDIGSGSKRLRKVYAVTFHGKSTSAQYADVAEKYTVDRKYQFGTVLQIAKGKQHEVEIFQGGVLAGVISKNPAYMLNSKIEGEYVVLTGQSPVICKGEITKGQYCIAQTGGFVIGVDKSDLTFEDFKNSVGVALYDSVDNIVMTKI